MKRKFQIIIFLSLALNAALIFGQEKPLTKSEFSKILDKTERNLAGKTYRVTMTRETFSDRDAKPEKVHTRIFEKLPPDRWREYEETRSSVSLDIVKLERIWDGKTLYERKNDGEWKKSGGSAKLVGGIISGRITKAYKFVEKTTLNGKTANVYEVEINRKTTKITETSREKVHYIEKTKYWIDQDGSILKKAIESEVVGSKSLIRDVWIYDYNPKDLKIEAPIK